MEFLKSEDKNTSRWAAKEIVRLLLGYQEVFKKGIITKKSFENRKKFNLDILIRINAMKEIIQQPRTTNLKSWACLCFGCFYKWNFIYLLYSRNIKKGVLNEI